MDSVWLGILTVTAACAALSAAYGGQGVVVKRGAKALSTTISTPVNSISVQLVSLAEGAALTGAAGGSWDLDLGDFSFTAAPRKPNVATRRLASSLLVSSEFGVLVSSSATGVTATLLALLQSQQAKYSVRIDGILLESTPVPVASHLRTGVVTRHRIELELPVTLTEKEGRLSNAIQFSVVSE